MRQRRDDSKVGRLRTALLVLLRQHEQDGTLPTSARFLFYELVSRGVISKDKRGARRPDQDVSLALTHLREDGLVPWDWVVDETRAMVAHRTAPTIAEYVLDSVGLAQIDRWNEDVRPFVLTESRSLAGVLAPTARDYAVPVASTNGQTSGSFVHNEAGPALGLLGDAAVVLYFGDLDLSGEQIEDNTRWVLEGIVGRTLRWHRLAITPEQVEQYGLVAIDKVDKRFHPPQTFPAVETEALSQGVIIGMLVDGLDSLLPEPLDAVRVREREQRARIAEALDGLS